MVCVILGVVMSALLMTLQIGELINGIGSAKVDLEAEARMLVDWITKDVRQSEIKNLYGNDPRGDHIKFNMWEWNQTGFNQQYTDEYVEYSYDNQTETLSREFRNENGDVLVQNFTGIVMPDPDPVSETGKGIFYTNYASPTDNNFNSTDLLNNRRIIVVIKKEKSVRNRLLNFTLVEEVKIRNE